jgi:hypothetical protein
MFGHGFSPSVSNFFLSRHTRNGRVTRLIATLFDGNGQQLPNWHVSRHNPPQFLLQ